MTSPRKHPTAGFWITLALVAVLVGYPLSFGPACWMVDCDLFPADGTRRFFEPLLTATVRSPTPVRSAAMAYCNLLHPPDPFAFSSGKWWILTDKQYRRNKQN
jgi:hypothetical protein